MANGTPGNGAAAPAGSVSAGTHLVREWNGRTYQVEVIEIPVGLQKLGLFCDQHETRVSGLRSLSGDAKSGACPSSLL